jgi:two-component system phosphate regulon sensor histidine kinase PhoR
MPGRDPSGDAPLLGLLLAAGASGGYWLGDVWPGIALALAVYVGICARRVRALARWLEGNPRGVEPPALRGPLGVMGSRMKLIQRRLLEDIADGEAQVARFRESFSALRDGIVILDAARAIEWCNPAAKRLLGLRFPEDRGQQVANLLRYPGFEAFLDEGDREREFEFTIPDARALTLQLQAADFGEASTVLFVRDLSAMKRLETIRQDFVGNISHELRTPLTVIAGYVDTLADLLDDSPLINKVLGQMRQQAVRMENLLKDLLLLSQLENDDEPDHEAEESIAACAMLESIRENALTACVGERTITLACDPALRFRASRIEAESIFSNLLFNAVKYSSSGGHIAVGFGVEGDALVFSVRDDGIGIDPVHIPRLTERFYRVEKSRSAERGGTGLGLAIVKHALIRLGGDLQVESRPGVGSTFRCRFPLERLEPGVSVRSAAVG